MLNVVTLSSLPDADSWLLEPLPLQPFEIRRREHRQRTESSRELRYLYFDIARGKVARLSRADRLRFTAAWKLAYQRYCFRMESRGEFPWPKRRYFHAWKGMMKLRWLKDRKQERTAAADAADALRGAH